MPTSKRLRKQATNYFSLLERNERISELAFGCVFVYVNIPPLPPLPPRRHYLRLSAFGVARYHEMNEIETYRKCK